MKNLDTYIIFDTETTGLNSKTDKIIEIGAVKVVEGKIIAKFNCLINNKIQIPAKITEITSITQKMVDEEGISLENAFKSFIEFIGTDLRMMGHNVVKFDIPFFQNNYPCDEFDKLFDRCIDTAAMFKGYKLGDLQKEVESHFIYADRILSQRHSIKYSINTCCEEFKIDKSKVFQHRAVGDCILTNEIFKNLNKILYPMIEKKVHSEQMKML